MEPWASWLSSLSPSTPSVAGTGGVAGAFHKSEHLNMTGPVQVTESMVLIQPSPPAASFLLSPSHRDLRGHVREEQRRGWTSSALIQSPPLKLMQGLSPSPKPHLVPTLTSFSTKRRNNNEKPVILFPALNQRHCHLVSHLRGKSSHILMSSLHHLCPFMEPASRFITYVSH